MKINDKLNKFKIFSKPHFLIKLNFSLNYAFKKALIHENE
jgi:hypothetical protein